MSLNEQDRQEIDRMIADRLEADGIVSILTSLDERQKEQLAQALSRFMSDRYQALRRPENYYTPRWINDGANIDETDAGVEVGFAGPTLPRIIEGHNMRMWLESRSEGQHLHIEPAGGGAMDCVPDHIVVSCYADLVAAGTHTEGQTFTSLGGCDFRMWSNITQTMADAVSVEQVVIICPGKYTGTDTVIAFANPCTIMGITPVDWSGLETTTSGSQRAELWNMGISVAQGAANDNYSVANIFFRPGTTVAQALSIGTGANAKIQNCGFIVAGSNAGVLLGQNTSGNITNCMFEASGSSGTSISSATPTGQNWMISNVLINGGTNGMSCGLNWAVRNVTMRSCTSGFVVNQASHDLYLEDITFDSVTTCLKTTGGGPLAQYALHFNNWHLTTLAGSINTVFDFTSMTSGTTRGTAMSMVFIDDIKGTVSNGAVFVKWPTGTARDEGPIIGEVTLASGYDGSGTVTFESGTRPAQTQIYGPILLATDVATGQTSAYLQPVGGHWDVGATGRLWYITDIGSSGTDCKVRCTAFTLRVNNTIVSVAKQVVTVPASAGAYSVEVDSSGTLQISSVGAGFTSGRLPLVTVTVTVSNGHSVYASHVAADAIFSLDTAAGVGATAPHNILDGGTAHLDSASDTVTRGSLIYGNSTPAWDELVIGAAGSGLWTDGTDASWTVNPTYAGYGRYGSASAPTNTTAGDLTVERLAIVNGTAFAASEGRIISAHGASTVTSGTEIMYHFQPTFTPGSNSTSGYQALTIVPILANSTFTTTSISGGVLGINVTGSGNVTTVQGFLSQGMLLNTSGSTFSATSAAGFATRGITRSSGTSTLTISQRASGLHVFGPSGLIAGDSIAEYNGIYIANQGNANITDAYGLQIEAPTNASATNIGLWNKGTSLFADTVTIDTAKSIQFTDDAGTGFVSLKAPATAQSEAYIYELPDDDPTAGQVLAVKSIAASPLITTEWITPSAGSGHTIRENGTDQTARTGLNFVDTDAGAGLITDDAGNDETEVNLNLYVLKTNANFVDLTDGGATTLHTHAGGSGHTIQDDNSSMTARTNLSFQDGFVLADDAGGDQTEIDLSYAGTGDIADVAYTEGAGTAITVARGDHVHALSTNFRQIFIPAERFRPTLSSGASAPHLIDSGDQDVLVFVMDFDSTSDEFAVTKVGLPAAYAGGTIDVRFVWMTSSSTNTHTCRWGIKGGFYDDATTLNTALGTEVFVDDNATATANQVLISDAVTMTLAGAASGRGMVALRITRDPDHANDDLNVDARLLGIYLDW